jgi:cell wall-associated NlpC family hydrolase
MRLHGSAGWLAGPAAGAALAAALLLGYAGDARAVGPGGAPGPGGLRAGDAADALAAAEPGPGGRDVTSARDTLVAAVRQLARLEAAARRTGQAYQQATARELAAKQASAQAGARAHVAGAAARQAESNLGRLVAAVYRYGPAQEAGALFLMLDVSDPEQYLDGVHTVRRVLVDASTVVARAQAASRSADAADAQAAAESAAVTADSAAVEQSADAATAAANAAAARVAALGTGLDALLGQEAAEQASAAELAAQAQAQAGVAGADVRSVPYDAAVETQALAFAVRQLGKPYLWGGAGPGAFDCSGLAMRAYEAAGVPLPHFAAFQYAVSRPLTYGQLRPGDLLFWATDPKDAGTIYHEAIYLGGQQMVQAPKTGWNVMVSDMWMWGPIQFYARP